MSDPTEQELIWNGPGGKAWVELGSVLDDLFSGLVEPLVEDLSSDSGMRVLDIGCGAGATTLAAARRTAPAGRCTGVDISEPLIEAARARAKNEDVQTRFICADAANHPFERGEFDALISRFGVMFFEDPVRAFANLGRAAAEGARLRFLSWRSAVENPFMTVAERSARPMLAGLPERKPGEPGQFAFADPDRVRAILERAGWKQVDIAPLDVGCALPERELVRYFTNLGPLGRALEGAEASARQRVIDTVRGAFDPYVAGDHARFVAACWLVTAIR